MAAPSAGDGPHRKVRELQQLLEGAKAGGVDTQAAERLDRESRAAARRGDQAQALAKIDEAIALLKKTGVSAAPAVRSSGTGRAPVFIVPFTHHYNGPGGYYATAAEVRQMGELFSRYRIPGTLFFDGILVERLQKEDPSLIPQINAWKLPIGYHGEETHGPYPVGSELLGEVRVLKEAQGYRGAWSLTTGRDWAAAVMLVGARYSHARDFRIDEKTRMINRLRETPTDMARLGGLALVQKTFGRDVSMMPSHALESAPEGYAFRRMSKFALDQPAVPIALHALKIFQLERLAGHVMRIAGENESIFWFMGRIMSKGDDSGEAGHRMEGLRPKIESLDRRRPHLLLMGCSRTDERDLGRTADYLEKEFFPKNPGSCWTSGETIMEYFEPEKACRLSAGELADIAARLTEFFRTSARPPDEVKIGAGNDIRIFSLTDVFEGLARALADFSKKGKLPDSAELHPLYGPLTETDDPLLAAHAVFTKEQVVVAATRVVAEMEAMLGDRFVPVHAQVNGKELNPGEFLHAMALAYGLLSGAKDGQVRVGPARAFPPYADILQTVFMPKTAQPLCYTKGQLWTVKPVRLRQSSTAAPASKAAEGGGAKPAAAPAAAGQGRLLVVFASNLENGNACHRDSHDGADLYRVEFDLESGRAANLKRLTRRKEGAEWFPSLSPDCRFVVYDESAPPVRRAAPPLARSPAAHVLRCLNLETGADEALVPNARCAAFSADGNTLFYSLENRGQHAIWRTPVQVSGSLLATGTAALVADERCGHELVEDPAPLPDGSAVVFHRKEDRRQSAGLALVNLDGSGLGELTPFDGCGHPSVCPDGGAVVCSRSRDGRIVICARKDNQWQPPVCLPFSTRAPDFAGNDPRFAGVKEARHSYVEWISPEWLLVTTHGADGERPFKFARIFVLKLKGFDQPPGLVDLSAAIETLAGKTGRDFCSASARFLPAAGKTGK
ncbi:MAG: hypothetical protein PHV34_06710 [Verrucomicrobiae bacterium]|nr:hypothetical protein [Verrucomicrobiae bacterium]